jgi:hypothetical protein
MLWYVQNRPHEELSDELSEYLSESPFGESLQHPLVQDIMYVPQANGFYNQQFEVKKALLEKSLNKKDWHTFVILHERPYRLDAFEEIDDFITSRKKRWELLSFVWSDSENIWQLIKKWKKILKEAREDKDSKFFMNTEERAFFKKLPREITVYRGWHEHFDPLTGRKSKNDKGLSYSISKEKAEWFSGRFQRKVSGIKERVISKEDAFAFLSRRSEKEIVIHPDSI